MKLHTLFEKETNSLLGKTISGKMITTETKNKKWIGNFDGVSSNLTSLEGAPARIDGSFNCRINELTSLEGAPSQIGGYFDCSNNKISSLQGIDKIIKEIGFLESQYNAGVFFASGNPIKSHVLGLLRIKGLKEVILDNNEVERIINKHLKGNRDILDCQSELIDAGLGEYAKL